MNRLYRLLRYDWPMHFILLATNWLPDNVLFLALRGALARRFLRKCGTRLRLGRNVVMYNPSQMEFGDDVYVAFGAWFMAGAAITVGSGSIFGPYSVVVSSDHSRENGSFRHGALKNAPIVIGRGCWVGAHAVLRAGVVLEDGCLVAAGGVVTRKVLKYTMVGGVPARVLKVFDGQMEGARQGVAE